MQVNECSGPTVAARQRLRVLLELCEVDEVVDVALLVRLSVLIRGEPPLVVDDELVVVLALVMGVVMVMVAVVVVGGATEGGGVEAEAEGSAATESGASEGAREKSGTSATTGVGEGAPRVAVVCMRVPDMAGGVEQRAGMHAASKHLGEGHDERELGTVGEHLHLAGPAVEGPRQTHLSPDRTGVMGRGRT